MFHVVIIGSGDGFVSLKTSEPMLTQIHDAIRTHFYHILQYFRNIPTPFDIFFSIYEIKMCFYMLKWVLFNRYYVGMHLSHMSFYCDVVLVSL